MRIARVYILWILINFGMGLLPVFVTWFIDYNINSFDYSDAVFLGMISFSFTLLVASYYSRGAWGSSPEVGFARVFTYIFLLLLLCLCVFYYYATRSNLIEEGSAQLISQNKFIVMFCMFAATLVLSSILNWPTITEHAINQRRTKREDRIKKSEEDFKKFNDEL